MPRVAQQISAAAQHYGFQLILISADVASGPREAASFLCKLELLEQGREVTEREREAERKSERAVRWNVHNTLV